MSDDYDDGFATKGEPEDIDNLGDEDEEGEEDGSMDEEESDM